MKAGPPPGEGYYPPGVDPNKGLPGEPYAGPGYGGPDKTFSQNEIVDAGHRFFGTITAYVSGPEAANYKFTSGLPVRLLGAMMPVLAPLMEEPGQYAVSAIHPGEAQAR